MGICNLLPMALNPVEKPETTDVWAVVFTGLSVVFLALVILIAFVWIMGKIFTIGKNKKKTPASTVSQTPVKPVPVQKAEKPKKSTAADADDEVIAVIAAAVAAMGQADGKAYKIRSVRPVQRNAQRSAWAMAGLQNNTSPF